VQENEQRFLAVAIVPPFQTLASFRGSLARRESRRYNVAPRRMPSLKSTAYRAALAAGVCLGAPVVALAQIDAAHTTAVASAQTTRAGAQEPPVVAEYPSLHLSGFADVDIAAQNKSEGQRGFSEGQFVLHLASALSPRVSFFGELSFSPRADAGTGSPAATGFNAEVERTIVRFDASDLLKVSFGRYHTPINWWNTAFHHGLWLQTTISRPEMVQFGGRFLPVHFVGALAEGSLPANGWNVNYQAGVGNGRGNVISRAGDAGDNNDRPAWIVNVFAKPDDPFGLQFGGSLYLDRVSLPGQAEHRERILSAHAVWLHEDPEIIAEIAQVRHGLVGGTLTTSNLAYYVQGAHRLPGAGRFLKPYYRFEHIDIDSTDSLFASIPNLDGSSTLGIRYDISTYAAIKSEVRTRRRSSDEPRTNGWFAQIAFTF
jgi:hypothetical protein